MMNKPAETSVPVLEPIRQRWSRRALESRPIPREDLLALFEAARWAPSSYNDQPWSFVVVPREEAEAHAALMTCLSASNQRWAGRAPLLVLTAARRAFDHNQKDNRHAWHDVGLAVENLVIQAAALGLSVRQMAGVDRERARPLFQVPESHDIVTALAIGYPGRMEELPEDLAERERAPRARKPLSAQVFQGRWGAPAPWLP